MRLQLEICRHTLPPVNILFNTASADFAVKTVFELLTAVNNIIPLESTNGEWGLEDYSVQVAATADQANLYECLHYQSIKDVLREDDEVLIRSLTSDELRERRRGGRFQILSDGRHLFDGVAWGKKYNAQAYRPGVAIPPRKKRRVLLAEDEDAEPEEEKQLQIEAAISESQVGTIINGEIDEDEEDDEDYTSSDEGSADTESQGESDSEAETEEENPLQLVTRASFDDADTDTDDDDDDTDRDGDDDSEEDGVQAENMEEEELQLLLQEAEMVEQAQEAVSSQSQTTSTSRKRKRVSHDDTTPNGRRVSFANLSPQTNEPSTKRIQGQIGEHVVTHAASKVDVDETKDKKRNGVGSRPTKKQQKEQYENPNLNGGRSNFKEDDESEDEESDEEADFHSGSSYDSSSSDSDSDSDSDPDSDSNSESDSELSQSSSSVLSSEADSTSSSGSSTDSDSDDTSSSDDSDAEPKFKKLSDASVRAQSTKIPDHPPDKPTIPSKSEPAATVAPGSGTVRTKSNNSRTKRRKQLNRLKEEGLLPPEAGFEDLRAFEAQQETRREAAEDIPVSEPSNEDQIATELAKKKQSMLARLDNVYQEKPDTAAASHIEASKVGQTKSPADQLEPVASNQETGSAIEPKPSQPDKSPQKRSRLDVASARRMLFGSLGLRNPKTPAAEQALREQLSQSVRNRPMRQVEGQPGSERPASEGSWKSKLIVRAIECVEEGVVLTAPPFPFRQHWEKASSKKKARSSQQYYSQDAFAAVYANKDEVDYFEPVQDLVPGSKNSKTISADVPSSNEVPNIPNFGGLPQLSLIDVREGAAIAYKELELNARYEPEESPYRAATILGVEEDVIKLRLSSGALNQPPRFDESTGERIYNRFELPADGDEDDTEDDGLREMTFGDMIGPKLVRAAQIQVPSSDRDSSSGNANTQSQTDSAVILESAPRDEIENPSGQPREAEVDTPRRDEILTMIKDAGFTSTLHEGFLQPTDSPMSGRVTSPRSSHSTASSKRSFEGAHQEKANTQFVRSNQGVTINDWRSSSFEPDNENDTSQPRARDGESQQFGDTSPPTVSLVETVDYPHVSRIDMNQSSLLDPTASSSHQDAQRVSPVPSDIEHGMIPHLQAVTSKHDADSVHSQALSLPSEVSQSQLAASDIQASDEKATTLIQSTTSARLRGGYRVSRSRSRSDCEDLDDDGLPSLSALTSSARNHLTRDSDSPRSCTHDALPTLRSSRSNDNTSRQIKAIEKSSSSSSSKVKVSASQKQKVNLLQLPEEHSLVDLTMSSDPIGADENRDDHDDTNYDDSPRARRAAARSSKMDSSQMDSQGSSQGDTGQSRGRGGDRRNTLSGKTRSRV